MRTVGVLLVLASLSIGWVGCGSGGPGSDTTLTFRIAHEDYGPGRTAMTVKNSGDTYYLGEESLLTEMDVESAEVEDRADGPVVVVLLNEEGAARLAQVTGENLGAHIGVVVAGELLAAPVVRARIEGGRAVIDAGFDAAEANTLAESITRAARVMRAPR